MLALVGEIALSARAVRADTSGTWDENLYLDMGYFAVRHHTWMPAVRFGTGPVPLLVAFWPALRSCDKPPADPRERERLIQEARFWYSLVVGTALVFLVHAWLRRHGEAWGVLGAAFVAFSPGVLGHVTLATTDAATAASMVLWLHVASRARRAPGIASLLLLALATGFAFATKHSTWPVGAVGLAVVVRGRGAAKGAITGVGFAVAAFVASWAFYGFAVVLGGPAPISSLHTRLEQAKELEFAWFFHGVRHSGDWCGWALLAAFLLKSTAAELGATLVLPAALVKARRRLDGDDALVLAVLVLYTGFLAASRAATTYRLLVPAQVLLVLATFSAVARLGRKKLLWAFVVVLLQLVAMLHAAPRFLSSFNGIACTSREAYRWLADSNLDWGQDLPALARVLDAHGSKKCALAYFGLTWPQAYGIRYEGVHQADLASCDFLAISATDLDAVNDPGDHYAPFRAIEPDDRAGDSILVYDLKRPEVRRALRR